MTYLTIILLGLIQGAAMAYLSRELRTITTPKTRKARAFGPHLPTTQTGGAL